MSKHQNANVWTERNDYLFLSTWEIHFAELRLARHNAKEKLLIFEEMFEELGEVGLHMRSIHQIEDKINEYTLKYSQMCSAIKRGEKSADDWFLFKKIERILGTDYQFLGLLSKRDPDEVHDNPLADAEHFVSLPANQREIEKDELSMQSYSDSENDKKRLKRRTRRPTFNNDTLRCFIEIWRQHLIDTLGNLRNGQMYEKISKQLKVQKGIDLKPQGVKSQVFNLMGKYKRLAKQKKAGETIERWPFFNIMEKITRVWMSRLNQQSTASDKMCSDVDGASENESECNKSLLVEMKTDENSDSNAKPEHDDLSHWEALIDDMLKSPVMDEDVVMDEGSNPLKRKASENKDGEQDVPKRKIQTLPPKPSPRLIAVKSTAKNVSTPNRPCFSKSIKPEDTSIKESPSGNLHRSHHEDPAIEELFLEVWNNHLEDLCDDDIHKNIANSLQEYGLFMAPNEVENKINKLIAKYRKYTDGPSHKLRKDEWPAYADLHDIMRRRKLLGKRSKSPTTFTLSEDDYSDIGLENTSTTTSRCQSKRKLPETDGIQNNLAKAMEMLQESQNQIATLVTEQAKTSTRIADSLNKFTEVLDEMKADNKRLIDAFISHLEKK